MQNIVRTAAAAALQTSLLLNKGLEIKPNSSLNQKFEIEQDTVISDSDRIAMRYVTIGNGGHRFIAGANGISRPEPVQHGDHGGQRGGGDLLDEGEGGLAGETRDHGVGQSAGPGQ